MNIAPPLPAAMMILGSVALAVWFYLLLGRNRFWRAGPRLEDHAGDPAAWPEVLAVVPARDEAAVVGHAVRSLIGQDYPGGLEVVVVDDLSSDGTAAIVERLALDAGPARRLRVIRNTPRPAGWSGKLWAVQTGIEQAEAAGTTAPLLLLTDADIAHHPATLTALTKKLVNEHRDLVSLMVMLRCESFWERLLIPPFVFFFQMLYPFPAVNEPGRPAAAAAGGCMLLRRAALADAGGIGAIRGALIDDVALGRAIKGRPGGEGRIWLGFGERTASLRAYNTLGSLWSMVARTADTELGHSAARLAGTMIGLLLVFLLPPLLLLTWPLHRTDAPALLGLAGWSAMSLAFLPTSSLYDQRNGWILTLPLAALLYTLMTIDSARRHRLGTGGLWKGRVFIE